VVALIIMLTCWVIASTAPEVDLEDGEGEISKPLFSRAAEEPADELEAMDWEADGEGEQATGSTKPGKGSAARRKRARRRAGEDCPAPPASDGPGRPRSAPVGRADLSRLPRPQSSAPSPRSTKASSAGREYRFAEEPTSRPLTIRTVASTSRSAAKSPLAMPSATMPRSTSSISTTCSRMRAAVSGERVAPHEVCGT